MKKFTKRLTMIVAVLLSLVLLTSSIVSTTLAKYVVTKDVTSTVGLQAFGLEVELKVDSKISHTKSSKGDSAIITINNFKLKPGDKFENAITASISGKPTVDANVTIQVDITDCTDSEFTVKKDDFTALSLSANKIYTPIGFFVGGTKVIASYTNYSVNSSKTTVLEEAIETALLNKIATNASNGLAKSGNTVAGTISSEITEDINITGIGIGFAWDDSNASTSNGHQEIGTYISKNEPTFTVTYKITVEQAS
jgi:hypothetical protein